MKRLIKWVSIIVLLLVVLLAAAPFFVPLDTVKKIATDKVKEATGRDLIIAGDIKASMWPDIGVKLQQVSLSNPEGYSSKNMAEIGDLTVQVALMPLLHGEVKINQFIIDKPIINLEVDKKGVANWEFAKKENKEAAAQEGATPAKPAAATIPALGEIKITNGALTYKDQRTGKTYNASKVDLGMQMESAESPLDIVLYMDYNKEEVNGGLHVEEPLKLSQGGDSKITTDLKIGSILELGFDGTASKNSAKGDIRLKSSSLVALSGLTGKKMDGKGDTDHAFSAGGILSCNDSVCNLNQSNIGLDENLFGGDVKINFAGSVPSVEAKLATDKLDLNYYLPKPEKQAFLSLISEAQAAPQGWDTKPIDFSGLKAANVKLSLEVANLLYQATTLNKLSLNMQIAGGVLALNIPHVELYSGTAKISATANSGGAISANLDMNNVQVEPMLKDFAGFDKLSGIANITTSITGNGTSQSAIVSSLSGKGDMKINDGSIRNSKATDFIFRIKSLVTGVNAAEDTTNFSELSGSYAIAQGIVKNEDLAMKAPFMRLSGTGTVDLPGRYVNYRLIPSVVNTSKGQGGKDKVGLDVPIIVKGPFEKVEATPDYAGIAQDALKDPEKVKDTVKTIKESIKKDNIKDLLKGFR